VNCGSCRYYVRDKRAEYPDNGQCHRFPPVLVWMQAADLGQSGDWGQDRPYMHKDEFCGEYVQSREAITP
jgi:hypothetical protein